MSSRSRIRRGPRAARPSPHPYLFFDAGDLDALRARAASPMKAQLDALREDAATHLDEPPPGELPGDDEEKADRIQNPFLARIVGFSLLAVVTGEARYRAAARRWALALARLPALVGEIDAGGRRCSGCGYGEGWAVTALAVAYDWLHPHWSASERALLVRKIRLYTGALHDAALAGEWWSRAYLHHDTWIPLGGMGLGALSILDEAAAAPAWAERAREEIATALSWLDDDGAWPEGPCGWAFALAAVTPFWDAYLRRFPERGRAILENRWLASTWRFRLASRAPDGRYLGFGDCSEGGGYQTTGYQGAAVLRWLAARYRNPRAQWLAAREWQARPNPYTAAWEIVWADPAVDEVPPGDAERGAVFENQAMAFVRTSFDRSATVLAFRATALLGRRAGALFAEGRITREEIDSSITHTHADAGSFAIWSRGDFAVTMAHYGQRETAFQNSLLVDGQGQYTAYAADPSGRPEGRITAFFSSIAGAFVEGEAARCYPPGLRRFTRRMFLVPPGIVLLDDDVIAEAPVALAWRIHVDRSASLQLGGDGFVSLLGGARTLVRLARPAGVRFGEITDRWNRAVTLSQPGRTAAVRLVAAIVPSVPDGSPASIGVASPGAFVVEALGARVLAAVAVGPGPLAGSDRLSSDGSAALVWTRGDERGLLAVAATALSVEGDALFEASTPVTLSLVRTGTSGRLTVSAPEAATLSIAVGRGRRVAVSVPEGQTTREV